MSKRGSTHLHPDAAASDFTSTSCSTTTTTTTTSRYYQHTHTHTHTHHDSTGASDDDDLSRIIADATARGEARAASKYPSTTTTTTTTTTPAAAKRASSPCPSTRSTDSARRRREAEDGYNPIQYEYEKKGGFRDWWRRQRLDNPHGAATLIEAVGQGFTASFGRLVRAGY